MIRKSGKPAGTSASKAPSAGGPVVGTSVTGWDASMVFFPWRWSRGSSVARGTVPGARFEEQGWCGAAADSCRRRASAPRPGGGQRGDGAVVGKGGAAGRVECGCAFHAAFAATLRAGSPRLVQFGVERGRIGDAEVVEFHPRRH